MSQRYKGAIISATPPTTSTSSASGEWTLAQQMQAQGASAWPVANPPDPYFNQVSLLLHGDGTNGGQNNTFVDSSTNNFTITRNGNTTQGTFTPFSQAAGYWSNYFDGNGDILTTSGVVNIGTGGQDFTLECWFYGTNLSVLNMIFGPTTTNNNYLLVNSSTIGTSFGTNYPSWNYNFLTNTWYHLVLLRQGGVLKCYVNGVAIAEAGTGNINTTATFCGSALYIGRYNATPYYFNGYISNVRAVNGTAVYTSNFTPPTSPLTAVSGTQLLTCQSNRFIDNSSNNFTITSTGDTKVTPWSPFVPTAAYSTSVNGGSGYFDGSGDYLTTAASSSLDCTGDFTFECFGYLNQAVSSPYDAIIIANISTYNTYIAFSAVTGNQLVVYSGASKIAGFNTTIPLFSWAHIAVVRSGTTLSAYLNGVSIGSVTYSATFSFSLGQGTSIGRGRLSGGAFSFWLGYLSNLRVVNGTALYTANFTPPTAPLTSIANTSLLLNCTNAAIYDNAIKNDVETVGNAQISTSVKKYGTGSMYFDGTGDYLVMPSSPNLAFGTGDFTIEGWVYLNGTQNFGVMFLSSITGAGDSLHIQINNANKVRVTNETTQFLLATNAISTSTWTHIAVVRNGTILTIYQDGIANGSTTNSTNFIQNGGLVGLEPIGGLYYFNGYIDDLRVTKGVARYTADFVPPIQAFPDY